MNKLLLTLFTVYLMTGCTLFKQLNDADISLENITAQKVKLVPNEPFDVSHEEVIKRYRRYLEVSRDSEMRVRTSHRVASLKLQADEIAWDKSAFNNDGEGLDNQTYNNQADADERQMALASIKDYEALLKEYPDRVDNDGVLYQLAKAYSLTGQPYQAIAVLEELALKYPRSNYYLEAEFRLGQLLYASGDYEASAEAYQRLIERGPEENKYYVVAGYFKGWAVFKQEKNRDALLEFTRVLDEHYPDADALSSAEGSDLDMLNDILRVMAVIFDYMGDWEQIALFYDEQGKRHYEYLLYDRLASQYYKKKYYKSGASTLRAFVERYPDDVLAPSYYERLISEYKNARYSSLMRKHKKKYIQRFGVGSRYWLNHNQAVNNLVSQSLMTYIWDLASFHHAWGQKSKKAKDKQERLQEAQKWYTEYVRSFPEKAETVKAHFLLAEVSFELKQYPLAKDHYEIVAYQYPTYEKAAEAGYAAILAFNAHRPEKNERLTWRQLTVASAMRFVQEFPQEKRRGTVLVNTAEMLLKDKYYQQALGTSRLAWEIKGNLPERYRYGAALVRGHSSFELAQYQESEQALLEASKYSRLQQGKKTKLREKVAAAIYKQGEQAKASGNKELAVKNWLRIAQVIPESDIRINAEYDAATLLMEDKQYDQAIDVLLTFRRQYPQHRLTADIPSKLIVAYESKEEWRPAAIELQTIWRTSKKIEKQRIACYQSAGYFEKAGDYDNAITMYKRYAHRYKKPFNAAIEAHFKLDQMYAAKKDEEKRRFWLSKVISLHLNAKKDQTDRSRYLAAKAAYELGEFERTGYEKVRLTLPLNTSITRKNALMQAALKRYTQAVQMGVLEYTTSSTYRIGELYGQLSKALMASERPSGMDEVEEEEYQFLLEDQAFPLEEAAIEVHQTNTGRTYDGLYDEWIKRSYRSLADLMPGQYNKQERALSYVDKIR